MYCGAGLQHRCCCISAPQAFLVPGTRQPKETTGSSIKFKLSVGSARTSATSGVTQVASPFLDQGSALHASAYSRCPITQKVRLCLLDIWATSNFHPFRFARLADEAEVIINAIIFKALSESMNLKMSLLLSEQRDSMVSEFFSFCFKCGPK